MSAHPIADPADVDPATTPAFRCLGCGKVPSVMGTCDECAAWLATTAGIVPRRLPDRDAETTGVEPVTYCGKHFPRDLAIRCSRPRGHPGEHENTIREDGVCYGWEDEPDPPVAAGGLGHFVDDRHALYVGWVLGIAHDNGVPATPVLDAEGNYTARLELPAFHGSAVTITIIVPPPPDSWTLNG